MLLHKKNSLNFVMVTVACILSVTLYVTWNMEEPLLPTAGSAEGDNGAKRKKSIATLIVPHAAVYRAVTEQNLFSPDRKEVILEPEPLKEEPVSDEKVIVGIKGKDIELYGVIFLGEKTNALIFNSGSIEKSKYQWVREGDMVGNLRVDTILKEKILLSDAGVRYELKLRNKKRKNNKAVSAKKAAPKVVTSTQSKNRDKLNAGKVNGESDEFEVIQTPFGDIRRRKR